MDQLHVPKPDKKVRFRMICDRSPNNARRINSFASAGLAFATSSCASSTRRSTMWDCGDRAAISCLAAAEAYSGPAADESRSVSLEEVYGDPDSVLTRIDGTRAHADAVNREVHHV